MFKRYILLMVALFLISKVFSQNQTFITIDDFGRIHKINVSNCTDKMLNFCTNFNTTPKSIALDGNLLYIVDGFGYLYSNILDTTVGTTSYCTKLGQFISKSFNIFGLTVGPGGIVYAGSGTLLETYDPSTKKFGTLGNIPSKYSLAGDLLFWQGNLYEAVFSGPVNSLLQINLANPGASTLYLTFTAINVYGIASVKVPCSENKLYAFSNKASFGTDVYAIDMINKVQASTITCSLNHNVYDAASVAETYFNSPPKPPVIITPVNYCLGDPVSALSAAVSSTMDTLKWYTQASGGTSTGNPIPAVSSNTVGTYKWYVSAFDTSFKCESDRQKITVNINPYPLVPVVSPVGTNIICKGNALLLTSSAATGNQWLLNGNNITGANATIYSATDAGDYTVTTTINGCSKTSSPTTINVTNAAISYPGSPFCNKGTQAVTITGATGGRFTATPSGLNIDASTGLLDLGKSIPGNYIITYTVGQANCRFTTDIAVVSIAATIHYSPDTFCETNSPVDVQLSSGSTLGGTYSAFPAGIAIDSKTGTITASSSTPGTYTITYNVGTAGVACGILTTTTKATIHATSSSTTHAKICNGNKYTFNGVDYYVAGKYPVHFTNLVGCDSTATLDLEVKNPSSGGIVYQSVCPTSLPYIWNGNSYNAAGSYLATLTNAAGCDSTITLNLSIPTIKIDSIKTTPENPVISGAAIIAQVISAANIDSAIWLPSTLFNGLAATQTFYALNDTFTIRVTAYAGACYDTASKLIVIAKNSVYIPNAFTPSATNNTNLSTFKIYGNSVKTATMLIYNQWGQMIKQLDDPKQVGWDGSYNGQPQPTGVYVYVVRITYFNNNTETKSGSINLIR